MSGESGYWVTAVPHGPFSMVPLFNSAVNDPDSW